MVVCRKCDVILIFIWLKLRHITSIQLLEYLSCHPILSNRIEYLREVWLALAKDLIKLNRDIWSFAQRMRIEEILSRIVLPQQLPLLITTDWRELMNISNQEQLHPCKWLRTTAQHPESLIYRIHHIGSHHTHLINYKQLNRTDQRNLILRDSSRCRGVHLRPRDIGPEG